jgi:BolA protein
MAQEEPCRRSRILARISEALHPDILEVADESHLHEGHAGAAPGGETHFALRIRAVALAGRSRVEQHRTVNALLADELRNGLHALRIEIIP